MKALYFQFTVEIKYFGHNIQITLIPTKSKLLLFSDMKNHRYDLPL